MNLGCCFHAPLSFVWPSRTFKISLETWTLLRICGLLLIFSWLTLPAHSATPINDRCSDAIVVPPSGPFPHFTEPILMDGATTVNDPPKPHCQTNLTRSLWYRFTPSESGLYSISTCQSVTSNT